MKKSFLWLFFATLAFSMIGCDCVTIRKLQGGQLVYANGNTYINVSEELENPLIIPDGQKNISVENTGNDSSKWIITNDNNSDNGNGNKNNVDLSTAWDNSVGGTTYHDDNSPYGTVTDSAPIIDTSNPTNERLSGNNINLIVNVTADYPRGSIPAQLVLDGVSIYSPHLTNSGQKNLEVSAGGYETLSKFITVPSGSTEHTVDVQLVAKPRVVNFDFSDKKTGKKLTADQVIIGSNVVRDGGKVKPGEHTLEISCKGYQTFIGSLTLPAGEGPYTLKRELDPEAQSITRIKWIIYTEYPAQEEIPVPQAVMIDGVEIEQGSKIRSGDHQVIVKHPGHETLRQNINVAKGLKVYTFKGTLKTLPRKVEAQIQYDIEPPAELGDTRVTLTSQSTGSQVNVGGGTSVKPGDYKLEVTKNAYITISKNVRIYPLLSPFSIKETLEAKPVVIKTEISYDITPPANLGPHAVDFVGRNIRQTVYHDGSIKPGRYTYKVAKTGYLMSGNEKSIQILPSEDPYYIRESMVVQPRRISLQINKDGKLVDAEEVYIDGEKVTFDKTFVPGKQYQLMAKFRNYQTVEKTINIPPGSGVYVLDVPLIRK